MEIQYDKFSDDQRDEIIELFRRVFTDSEGEEEGKLIGNLVSKLIERTPAKDLYGYTASQNSTIVGAVFFSRMTFEDQINAFILSPMAVQTDYHGMGIGRQLISFAIKNLKDAGAELLITYGDIEFYSKTGFKMVSEDEVPAPLILSYPQGWLAQVLTETQILPIRGSSQCVEALNDQVYW